MSARMCPWCGGANLRITNCMATHSKCEDGAVYWEDRDCGYREVTTHEEKYDYKLKKYVPRDIQILSLHKPKPPLPLHQQPEYLRNGAKYEEIPEDQQTLGDL